MTPPAAGSSSADGIVYDRVALESGTEDDRPLGEMGRQLRMRSGRGLGSGSSPRSALLCCRQPATLSTGLLVVAIVAIAFSVVTYYEEAVHPVGPDPTIRQLMEGHELREVMTDNLMTLGHSLFSEDDRAQVRDTVNKMVQDVSKRIKKDSPETDEQMDKLTVDKDDKEKTLNVMWTLSDPRLESVAKDVNDALHDAADFDLDRDSFKTLMSERLQHRMQEMEDIRAEIFPERNSSSDSFGSKGHFKALYDGMDTTRMVQSWDAWREKAQQAKDEYERKARESWEKTKESMDSARENWNQDWRKSRENAEKKVQEDIAEVKENLADAAKKQADDLRKQLDDTLNDTLKDSKKMVDAVTKTEAYEWAKQKEDEEAKITDAKEDEEVKRIESEVSRRLAQKRRLAKAATAQATQLQLSEFFEDMKDRFGDKFTKPPASTMYGASSDDADSDAAGDDASAPERSATQQDVEVPIAECLKQLIELDPATFMTCAMQTMTFCLDVMRAVA